MGVQEKKSRGRKHWSKKSNIVVIRVLEGENSMGAWKAIIKETKKDNVLGLKESVFMCRGLAKDWAGIMTSNHAQVGFHVLVKGQMLEAAN